MEVDAGRWRALHTSSQCSDSALQVLLPALFCPHTCSRVPRSVCADHGGGPGQPVNHQGPPGALRCIAQSAVQCELALKLLQWLRHLSSCNTFYLQPAVWQAMPTLPALQLPCNRPAGGGLQQPRGGGGGQDQGGSLPAGGKRGRAGKRGNLERKEQAAAVVETTPTPLSAKEGTPLALAATIVRAAPSPPHPTPARTS